MKSFDRAAEDVGNIVLVEHLNVTQPDQRLATLFYVVGLGGTRDPYLMVGLDNMWVNFGRHQIHLPTRVPQCLRGTTGMVLPDLRAARARLGGLASDLGHTRFAWQERDGVIEATCPWGNRFRCHPPSAEFGDTELGLVYVEFDVPRGAAAGIARFYQTILDCPSVLAERRGAPAARVVAGRNQLLWFRETADRIPPYDGHHIAVYLSDFSGPYRRLLERGLVSRESDEHEWRFQAIVDPETSEVLFEIEHEIRSLRHPLFARPLVNRNPVQSNRGYVRGQDAFRGTF